MKYINFILIIKSIIVALLITTVFSNITFADKRIIKLKEAKYYRINQNIVNETFRMFGSGTSTGKEKLENKLKGKIVNFKLIVHKVSNSDEYYKILTISGNNCNTGCSKDCKNRIGDSKYICFKSCISHCKEGQYNSVSTISYVLKDKRYNQYIENLKSGDKIRIKGVFKSVFFGHIIIQPAILLR